jgi:glycerate kinase
MRILIAPNAFKGTYSATQAATAIAAGLRAAGCRATLDLMPLADGGPGTLACMKGRLKFTVVHDALGRKRRAQWLLLPSKKALIESAQAIGLTLIPASKRDPLACDTYGLGELMLAAKKAGCKELFIGLGGSATTDAGAGMAQALGWRISESGNFIRPAKDPMAGLSVKALCDVDNPLYGRQGAAHVYGPQKGASGPQVRTLDARLRGIARQFPRRLSAAPGAGAAGGLGFGLLAFCGAKLVPGARTLLGLNGFEGRLKASDWALSGEGRFDAQSLRGKLPYVIFREARRLGKPCTLLVGQRKGRFPGVDIMKLRSQRGLKALSSAWWRLRAAAKPAVVRQRHKG